MKIETNKKLGWVYYKGIGRVYYNYNLTAETGLWKKRKYYLLKRFAVASCKPFLGFPRGWNREYRKYFEKRGYNTKGYVIHHEIDGRIYLIDKKIHQRIAHNGMIRILGLN